MEKSLFEQAGGKYEWHGDYLIPCLTYTAEEKPIGVWGQRRLQYLKHHRQTVYMELLTSGQLNRHLDSIDRQAKEMLSRMVKRMAEREGVTEQLKAADQMEWVGRMNNIRNRAMEVVYNDLIYS